MLLEQPGVFLVEQCGPDRPADPIGALITGEGGHHDGGQQHPDRYRRIVRSGQQAAGEQQRIAREDREEQTGLDEDDHQDRREYRVLEPRLRKQVHRVQQLGQCDVARHRFCRCQQNHAASCPGYGWPISLATASEAASAITRPTVPGPTEKPLAVRKVRIVRPAGPYCQPASQSGPRTSRESPLAYSVG